MAAGPFEAHEVDLHGHRAVYRVAGSGPNLVLIHGMINSSRHWQAVAERLADSYRVIAPDLIGHGDSATPRGDYSLGAHAASIRDLLTTIGVERATIVGHSLGGGVAMQFFYQFPQRTERLGAGLQRRPRPGRQPAAARRRPARLLDPAAAGQQPAPGRLAEPRRHPPARARRLHRRLPAGGGAGARPAAGERLAPRLPADAARGDRRPGPEGQRPRPPLPARRDADPDRLGRARPHDPDLPWPRSERRDPQLPLRDAARAAHFPNLEDPEGLATILRDWIATTTPHRIDDSEWGDVIAHRARRLRPAA